MLTVEMLSLSYMPALSYVFDSYDTSFLKFEMPVCADLAGHQVKMATDKARVPTRNSHSVKEFL